MANCTISCVWRDGKAVGTVTWDTPLDTGELFLPVTHIIDEEGDFIEMESILVFEENPLCRATAVIAGPDAEGMWLTVSCVGEFSKFD